MPVMRMQYGPVSVSVRYVGEGVAPGDPTGSSRYQYSVIVSYRDVRYTTPVWGSIRDFEEGRDPEDVKIMRYLGQLVIEELESALADPDEFFNLVIGEARGREAYERGKSAERVIRAAQRFGDVLYAAAEEVRAEQERY